jgi:hypothetical protein
MIEKNLSVITVCTIVRFSRSVIGDMPVKVGIVEMVAERI